MPHTTTMLVPVANWDKIKGAARTVSLSSRIRGTCFLKLMSENTCPTTPQIQTSEVQSHLSRIGHSMIQKQSYSFNDFVATRVEEIQEDIKTENNYWFWMGVSKTKTLTP